MFNFSLCLQVFESLTRSLCFHSKTIRLRFVHCRSQNTLLYVSKEQVFSKFGIFSQKMYLIVLFQI